MAARRKATAGEIQDVLAGEHVGHDPFDDFTTEQATRPTGRACLFYPKRMSLTPDRRDALDRALATESITPPTIVDVLKKWGLAVTPDAVRRHRPNAHDPCQHCARING